VRGGTLMRGYLGQPQATARALRQGWLHTGDMGMLDAGGRLRVLDRREDLIVSGGENIYPAEVEAVLMAHPAVLEAAVVGEPDAEFGARPLAWWVAAQPGSEAPDLASHCRRHLAGYKIPRRFVRVAELPRNAAGKLLRRAMRPDA
jgi:O-succinylbenzoic acid--CoA ligase